MTGEARHRASGRARAANTRLRTTSKSSRCNFDSTYEESRAPDVNITELRHNLLDSDRAGLGDRNAGGERSARSRGGSLRLHGDGDPGACPVGPSHRSADRRAGAYGNVRSGRSGRSHHRCGIPNSSAALACAKPRLASRSSICIARCTRSLRSRASSKPRSTNSRRSQDRLPFVFCCHSDGGVGERAAVGGGQPGWSTSLPPQRSSRRSKVIASGARIRTLRKTACAGLTSRLRSAGSTTDGTSSAAEDPEAIQRSPNLRAPAL